MRGRYGADWRLSGQMTADVESLRVPSLARKLGRILLILASIPLACLSVLLGALMLLSPGRPRKIVDESGHPLPNGLSEKVFVDVNGARQGMFVESKNTANPVLLYLHGGLPDHFLTERYPTGLEDLFTVVWWEQRGSGLSFSDDIPPESLTTEQMISDTLALTNYLCERFGKEKIYLMGHSGGSFFGIQVAARAPELYCAYIGMSQMVDQLESERLCYEYMLEQFRESGDTEWVRRLEAAPVTREGGAPEAYLRLRDDAMHPLGIGTMHDMHSHITGVFLPSWLSRDYTLFEKVNLWRGKFRYRVHCLWDEIKATNLAEKVPELAIPVYFLDGKYDYTCSYTLQKSYLQRLKAPLKGFYTFDDSAHCPFFEEPQKTLRIMREDVLAGRNSLADAP